MISNLGCKKYANQRSAANTFNHLSWRPWRLGGSIVFGFLVIQSPQ
jgi:hypothetical protein